MYRDRDFDVARKIGAREQALIQDLELTTLFSAMSGGDSFLFDVATQAVLFGLENELDTISYRQAALRDCLQNYSIVETVYNLAMEAIESEKKQWFAAFRRHPSSTLYSGSQLLQMLTTVLARLKSVAEQHADAFRSEGFRRLFMLIIAELPEEYLARMKKHVKQLEFNHGMLLSAQLGKGNKGSNYLLHEPPHRNAWIERIVDRKKFEYTFQINDRDEAGARALSELRDRGINEVANAIAQAADHVLSFFVTLRAELAFYIGCANLHRRLQGNVDALCFPKPFEAGTRKFSYGKLRDTCLALTLDDSVVANDLNADGKKLFIITGANQGGKSTLLRAIGLAQLMMQCGMFVTAETFSADLCRSLFTHYKREEDITMQSGKLDEELSRMSDIVDALRPDSVVLFNESFSATNEREGSEIASQVVHALVETRTKIFFVTHLYEFANRLWEERRDDSVFLRAERQADGRRTFKLLPGGPLQTSFGPDLYKEIFSRGHRTAGGMIVERSPI